MRSGGEKQTVLLLFSCSTLTVEKMGMALKDKQSCWWPQIKTDCDFFATSLSAGAASFSAAVSIFFNWCMESGSEATSEGGSNTGGDVLQSCSPGTSAWRVTLQSSPLKLPNYIPWKAIHLNTIIKIACHLCSNTTTVVLMQTQSTLILPLICQTIVVCVCVCGCWWR